MVLEDLSSNFGHAIISSITWLKSAQKACKKDTHLAFFFEKNQLICLSAGVDSIKRMDPSPFQFYTQDFKNNLRYSGQK